MGFFTVSTIALRLDVLVSTISSLVVHFAFPYPWPVELDVPVYLIVHRAEISRAVKIAEIIHAVLERAEKGLGARLSPRPMSPRHYGGRNN